MINVSREPGMKPHEVVTRDDLVRYLSQSLTGEYKAVVGDDEIRNTSTLVKSYVVEMHDKAADPVSAWRTQDFAEVNSIPDQSLIRVLDEKGTAYFVDVRDQRFQLVHTIGKANQTDETLRALTSGPVAGFDHAWMPGGFLKLQSRGQLTGFAFRFEDSVDETARSPFEHVDHETGEILPTPLKKPRTSLKASEQGAAEIEYRKMLESDIFQGRKALDQIEFQSVEPDDRRDYTVSNVYYWGKVVTRGTWIGGHLATVDSITANYRRVVEQIEQEFALGWTAEGDGYVHKGKPFEFHLPSHAAILDLGRFVQLVFSSTKPFRLFGIPEWRSRTRIDVSAIDLHSGDPVDFEITERQIRVYLPVGSCGNVIARLYTNLQRSANSEFDLAQNPFIVSQHAV